MPTVNDTANTTTKIAVMIRFIPFTSFRFSLIEPSSRYAKRRPRPRDPDYHRTGHIVNQALSLPPHFLWRPLPFMCELMPSAIITPEDTKTVGLTATGNTGFRKYS